MPGELNFLLHKEKAPQPFHSDNRGSNPYGTPLIKQLPKEEVDLLKGVEQRRVMYQAIQDSGLVRSKRPMAAELLVADTKREIASRNEPITYEQHDLEAEPYDPRYLEEHEAEIRAAEGKANTEPPVDEAEFPEQKGGPIYATSESLISGSIFGLTLIEMKILESFVGSTPNK